MYEPTTQEDYISDAEMHNSWWSGDTRDLERVRELPFRSDFFRIVTTLDQWRVGIEPDQATNGDGIEPPAVLPYAGPNGIGKTRLLQQVIAAIIDSEPYLDWPPRGQGHDSTARDSLPIVNAVRPNNIFYVPVEESLYDLEEPGEGIKHLKQTIGTFLDHTAFGGEPNYVFVDDLGALDTERDLRAELLDAIGDDTYLIVTDTLASAVDFSDFAGAPDGTAESGDPQSSLSAADPFPILPIKFVDYVRWSDDSLDSKVSAAQTSKVSTGEGTTSPIKAVRDAFRTGADGETLCTALDNLYTYFDESQRDVLDELSKSYLRNGGFLYRMDLNRVVDNDQGSMAPIDTMLTKRIRDDLQLTLLKEVAPRRDFKRPKDLIRVASLAAQASPPKFEHQQVADILDVDRRTVNRYLEALEEATVLKQSREFSIARHRRAMLHLRDPRYIIALSRRMDHEGYTAFDWLNTSHWQRHNHTFRRRLALSVAFDHASRLSGYIRSDTYRDTDVPTAKVEHDTVHGAPVDYIIHDRERVYPFVLNYQPQSGDAHSVATQFDPSVGAHQYENGLEYTAPVRIVITDDSAPGDESGLPTSGAGTDTVVTVPYWLFLLCC